MPHLAQRLKRGFGIGSNINPTLTIVVINHRTSDLTIECLASLASERTLISFAVVVVDNASGDGSAERIEIAISKRGWSDWVHLKRSPVNGGFSAGNNVGIQAVHADAYLLLNSDTIVREGAIAELLNAMTARPEAGLIGPRLEGPNGDPHSSCFRWPTPMSELIRGACSGPVTSLLRRWNVPCTPTALPQAAEWISFAAVLVRREVIEQVGPMDEGYFMYFEDIDYCRRARIAGWTILHWPSSRIVHLHGKSSKTEALKAKRARRPSYYYEARSRYFRKWHGRPGLWAANLAWCIGRCLAIGRELLGRPRTSCRCEWLDNWSHALTPASSERTGR